MHLSRYSIPLGLAVAALAPSAAGAQQQAVIQQQGVILNGQFGFGVDTSSAKTPGAQANNASVRAPADTAVMVVQIRSSKGEQRGQLAKLLKNESAKARAIGRTPIFEVGAASCMPCREFEGMFKERSLIDAFAGTYVVHLDMDEWEDENYKEIWAVGFNLDVPALYHVSADGRPAGAGLHGDGIFFQQFIEKGTLREIVAPPEKNTPELIARRIKTFLEANPWKSGGKAGTTQTAGVK